MTTIAAASDSSIGIEFETAWSVDWLSVTFKSGLTDLDIRKAVSFGFPLKTWTQTQARFGYSVAFVHPFGHTVMANYGRPEMGVHLSFGGRALRSLAEGGIEAVQMLAWSIKQGGKITRIDLAIDVFDTPIDPMALAQCDRMKDAPGNARKWDFVKGHDGGCTAYIGSRKSERFLRIYDKAAQMKQTERPWTRFELEFKGDSAKAAAFQMSELMDNERPMYIQGLIKAMFNPNDPIFQAVMVAEATPLQTQKDTEDNTVDWLLNSVAKTIAKTMMRRSDLDIWNMIVEAVHHNLTALSDGKSSHEGSILGLSDENASHGGE